MKVHDPILFATETGRVLSGRIVSLTDDARAVVQLHDSQRQETVPLELCAPMQEAFVAFSNMPGVLQQLADALAVTVPAAPALDASQPGPSPERDAAPVTEPGPVTAGESQSAAPSPELASAAALAESGVAAGDSATANATSSVTPPDLLPLAL